MMRPITTFLNISLLLLISCAEAFSQTQASRHWLLGNGTHGIRFDSDSAILITKPAVTYGGEGGAVATDASTGLLLFYTDGANVYDINHALMPNGGGLAGDPSRNNPVAIAPVPGQPDQYYVFTNSATGAVQFSIVDMSQFGGGVFPSPPTGDVTQKNQGTPIPAGQAEGMIVIPHTNGTDYWLITQTAGTTDYTVTQVAAAGVLTSTTFSGVGFSISASSFAYDSISGRLAVASQDPNVDVAILNFNRTTGALVFNQVVVSSGVLSTNGQAIYDVEWSPDGRFLYLSMYGDAGAGIPADVLQYDFNNPTNSLTSVIPQPPAIFESYGLQLAPDSSIYHLYRATAGGPILMGKISDPDTLAAEVNYVSQAFPGNINFNAMQFPSFSPPPDTNLTISFTSNGTCTNTPVSFFPTVTPAPDSLSWRFGDGQTATAWSPIHTYQNGGSISVTLRAYLNGRVDSVTQTINLTQFDLQLQLVQDTTACICEFKPPVGTSCNGGPFTVTAQAQNGSPTYQWFGPSGQLAGQTSASLVPDSAGYYYVRATIGACSTYAGVNIKTYDSLDQRANIWHFGQEAGIDFNAPYFNPGSPPVPIQGPFPVVPSIAAPEGVSTISDRNGQVIFSTNGQFVWDRTKAQVPGDLGGSPNSTQSSIIVPFPGDETLFYIFTTQAADDGTFELKYSIFDSKLNPIGTNGGGLVDLDASTAAVDASKILFDFSTERLIANNSWVITHDYGTNCFRAFPITQNGIGSPVISCVGSDHALSSVGNAEGYMKLGGNNKLAVGISTPGVSNVVEVFDFDNATGAVTNPHSINIGSPNADSQVYGLEFSGDKLFATLTGNVSHIVEMFIDSLSVPHIVDTTPIPPINAQLGAIQTGPDGQVYVAVNGADFLGTISVNADTTQNSTFTLQGFQLLTGTRSTLGLPNFIQSLGNPTQGPSITATGTCAGSPTDFTASGKDSNIDKFDWIFGDGNTQSDGGPEISHTYATAGTYTVSVTIWNKCETVGTFSQQIVITAPPANPTFIPAGGSPVLCTGPITLEATPPTNPDLADLQFVWSTGETTRTITVNQQAIYSVTIIDNVGCSSTGNILVAEQRPIVDLGADQTICQNTPIFPLDAQNPGATYQWTINGTPSGTTQTQSVDTSLPGQFDYAVQVVHPFFPGCTGTDNIVYTINEIPVFTATPIDPTNGCPGSNGRIDLTITSPVTSLFTYSILGPVSVPVEIDQPAGTYSSPSTLSAGTYGVTVADQVSGCAGILTVTLNNTTFTVAGNAIPPLCDPITIAVTTTAVAPISYRVIDAATGTEVVPSTNSATSSFNTTPLVSGTYIIEVTETATSCVNSSAAIPAQQNAPDIIFDTSDICDGNISVTSNPAGATFDWSASPPGSINTVTGASSETVNVNPGTWDLVVKATIAGDCGTENITVTIDNASPTIAPPLDPCQDQVVISATPTGSFLYRWSRNGSVDNTLAGSQVIATTANNGNTYQVDILSTLTGCVYSSPTITVNVFGTLDINLTATPACEGSPFTITATTTTIQPPTYAWTFNGAVTGTNSATLTDTRGGTYNATATVFVGNSPVCTDQESIQILISPITDGKMNDRAIICDDPANTDPATNQVVLRPGPGFSSFNWSKDGVALGVTDSTYTATERGLYAVNLVNIFGCASTDQTQVDIECTPKITGPNAFRPGGVNSDFFLYTFFIADTDFTIFIFNRWGEMVYQSTQRNFRWNGGYNNSAAKPLPPGTYAYIVKYKSAYQPGTGVQEKRGGVVLLR